MCTSDLGSLIQGGLVLFDIAGIAISGFIEVDLLVTPSDILPQSVLNSTTVPKFTAILELLGNIELVFEIKRLLFNCLGTVCLLVFPTNLVALDSSFLGDLVSDLLHLSERWGSCFSGNLRMPSWDVIKSGWVLLSAIRVSVKNCREGIGSKR